jgi:hypothetical protein
MFLKEKIDGTTKARGCADGRLQMIYTSKVDTSSPTVSIEAMMLSRAIDAKENRYVVVSDIPGAFLHADMEDNVHMLLEGTVTEMIVKPDPTIYRKHIWYNKHGKPMLYVQLKNSTTILENTARNTTGVGICTKTIQQMCSKQKHRRKAMYHMARRQLKGITCKQRHSEIY